MSTKSKKYNDKKVRRELEAAQAKRKKRIILAIVLVFIAALVTLLIVGATKEASAETYAADSQSVRLNPDGSFVAILAHGARVTGVYNKTEEGDKSVVEFIYNDTSAIGEIEDGNLNIPDEWIDACGHETVFAKQ